MPTTRSKNPKTPKANGGETKQANGGETRPRGKAKAAPPQAESSQVGPAAAAIAHRAYELFVARGGEHGRALDDWVAAERELSSADSSAP